VAFIDSEQSTVLFQTYEAYFANHYATQYQGYEQDDGARFLEWFEHQAKSIEYCLDASMLYQEFSFITSFADVEDFLNHFKRESVYGDDSAKKEAYSLYKQYAEYRQDLRYFDIRLDPLEITEPEVDYAFYDEAMDNTHQQLHNLMCLPTNQNILLAMDSNQSLNKLGSIRPFALRHAQHVAKQPVNHVVLNCNYRNSKAANAVANLFLKAKNAINKGVGDQDEYTSMSCFDDNLQGFVEVVASPDLSKHQALIVGFASCHDCAIIVNTEADKALVRKHIDTPNIFTPEEIKGLEFEHIILWQLLDSSEMKALNEQLPQSLDD
jgi:DNA helicase IV